MQITKKTIYDLFKKIGMPIGFSGFDYTCDLVLSIKETFDRTGSTKLILQEEYKKIAKNYNVSHTCVERAIRYFIETGFNRITPLYIDEVFGCTMWDNGYPPNKEFIYTIYNYIVYGN